jgi:hypothetical protein
VSNNPLRYIDPSGHFCVEVGGNVICSEDDDDSNMYWWPDRSSDVVYKIPLILQFGPGTTRSLPLQKQSLVQKDGESLPIELFYPYPNPVDSEFYESTGGHLAVIIDKSKVDWDEFGINVAGLVGDIAALKVGEGTVTWLLSEWLEIEGISKDIYELRTGGLDKIKEKPLKYVLTSVDVSLVVDVILDCYSLPPATGVVSNTLQIIIALNPDFVWVEKGERYFIIINTSQ